MGDCTSAPSNRASHTKSVSSLLSTKMKPSELELIKLMYNDLACRSKDNILTREVFDTFFHLGGLWAQEMFRTFDKSKQGKVKYQQFVGGIELMVKGTFQQRSKLLFKFYDIDNTGGIFFNELLKMLYSYSKEDLKQMITEQNFLKTIDNYQLLNFFKPEQEADMNVIEEAQQNQQQKQIPERKHSEYMPSSTQFIEMQEKFQKEMAAMKNKKSGKVFLNQNNKENGKTPHRKNRARAGSMLTIPTYTRKNLKLTNNVASLVKKYAAYIFNEMKLDKTKDQINLQNFLTIVKNHQKIFNIYFEGFHSYVWMLEDNSEPEYLRITPFIESPCVQVYKGQKNQRYLKYIKTTLFTFTKKKKQMPEQIKNMQGLVVEAKGNENGHGIVVKHRDGIYPEKQYYFQDQATQKQWLRYLAEFKENSIYNTYQIMQKIGAGNFSSVYRGIQKKSQKQVAVKVIQKFKLSLNQKQVIKFEKSILELCHHPNIIRYEGFFDTKTRIYIVTELLTDGDLFQYTKKSTFLQQYEAAYIFKQLVQAIQYINGGLGLIHRDLKPQNVLITLNRDKNAVHRVKLIDFGFAVYKDNLKNLPDKQKFAGTPGFVAPQIFLGQQYDESVDMFSLGIIMYFMLCGHLPFSSPIYQQIVELTRQCSISLTNAHWSNVSNEAKDLLSKILTFKQSRINSSQVLEHPWLHEIQNLKRYSGKNKKLRYNG